MSRFPRSLIIAFALLATAALGVGTVSLLPNVLPALSHAADQALTPSPEAHHAAELSDAFRTTAKIVRPSVVSIDSVKIVKTSGTRGARPDMKLPPEFERFFGDDFFDHFGAPDQGGQGGEGGGHGMEQRGLGTGVIVSSDGYIVTNNHVVRDADKLTVHLFDGRELKGEVVGTDAKTDLAVVKVDASGLTPAKLGDSSAMEVGDWVIAVGTPFGLEQTVTSGIISATGRNAVGITDYEDFLQTDAAINPGNSGGPLVNMQGQVVGINTAIASRTGSYNGIGFAIPSNMVKHVMQSIIKTGHVDRGWLGAAIQDLSEGLAQSFGFESKGGVLVGDVVKGGPAEKAGLKSGDIVVEFDGKTMHDSNELRHTVANTVPNSKVDVVVYRDGARRTIPVTIGLLKEEQATSFVGPSKSGNSDEQTVDKLGVSVAAADSDAAAELGVDKSTSGAVVTKVEAGSAASRGGLQPGDVIVGVDSHAIKSTADFASAAKNVDLAKGVRLSVQRDGVRHFVFLRDNS